MTSTSTPPHLPDPPSPLPEGASFDWLPRHEAWLRIYHRDYFTPGATHFRSYGPLHRFDHHTPPHGAPEVCPEGRAVIYLANTIRAAAAEVFGEVETFRVCPQWRLAWLSPTGKVVLQDITGAGAMAIRMKPGLGSAPAEVMPREYTQRWARCIYDEHPAVGGIRYTGSHEEGRCMAVWERSPALELVHADGSDDEHQLIEPQVFSSVLVEYLSTGNSLDVIDSGVCDYCKSAAAAAAAA